MMRSGLFRSAANPGRFPIGAANLGRYRSRLQRERACLRGASSQSQPGIWWSRTGSNPPRWRAADPLQAPQIRAAIAAACGAGRCDLLLRTNPEYGGAGRDRTDDLKLAKLPLSQLSYGPEVLSLGSANPTRCRACLLRHIHLSPALWPNAPAIPHGYGGPGKT